MIGRPFTALPGTQQTTSLPFVDKVSQHIRAGGGDWFGMILKCDRQKETGETKTEQITPEAPRNRNS